MNTNVSLPPPTTIILDIPLPVWAIITIAAIVVVSVLGIIYLVRRK
jgi:hypothetical protein